MKKLILSVFAIVAISFAANAQTEFGVNAGLGVSSWTGDNDDALESKFSYEFGLTAHTTLSYQFNLLSELDYSNKGTGYDQGEDTNVNYITLGVSPEYMVSENFGIHLGPQVGFLTSISDDDLSDEGEDELKDALADVDFGLDIGANYYTISGWGFGAKFNPGLADIADDGDADLSNNLLNFKILYKFNQ